MNLRGSTRIEIDQIQNSMRRAERLQNPKTGRDVLNPTNQLI